MNREGIFALFLILSLEQQSITCQLWPKNPSAIILENQLYAISNEQQHLASQLMANGIHQVESSERQLQASRIMQTSAANVLSAKGLDDLNGIERSIALPNVLQCYQLNKFTFDDAINTAKTTAMQCITDKLNEGKEIADNAMNDIRTAMQEIGNATQMIGECRQFLTIFPSVAGAIAKIACLSEAIINMKSGAILLPINLGRRVIEANEAISTIHSDVMKCNLNILSAIITQATEAGRAIAECISGGSSSNSTNQFM